MAENTLGAESSQGIAEAVNTAYRAASSIHAVPQLNEVSIDLDHDQKCVLKRYKYKPLARADEIRILRIYPWKDRLQTIKGVMDVPRCELIHVALDSSPKYEAMSYAWGDLQQCSPVLVSEEEYVAVTRSLVSALHRLSCDKTVDVWADQLCINQYDHAERGDQVRLMSRIFGQATRTFVWLGANRKINDATFCLIIKLANTPQTFEVLLDKDKDDLQQILQSHHISPDYNELGWHGINALSSMLWFTRLWTFQEVVVAKDIIVAFCNYRCSLGDLKRALYFAQRLHGASVRTLRNIQIREVFWRRCFAGSPAHLSNLLIHVSECGYDCTDPRDRIYALLALHSSQAPCSIHVDYSKPVENAFLEAAKSCIVSTGNLNILHRRQPGCLETLPSWVPDWTAKPLGWLLFNSDIRFNSSHGLRHVFEQSPPEQLLTKGKAVAKIVRLETHRFEGDFDFHALSAESSRHFFGADTLIPQVLTALETCAVRNSARGFGRILSNETLLAMTLTAGQLGREDMAVFEADNTSKQLDLVTGIMKCSFRCRSSVYNCYGRKVAMLDVDNYPLGLVPDNAQPGDLVCILNGADLPLLLRQRADQDFDFIDQCYVHGIMNGEAVTWSEGEGDVFRLG